MLSSAVVDVFFVIFLDLIDRAFTDTQARRLAGAG
jgi:hypothetical protein